MQAEEIGLLLKQERGQFLEFVSAHEYRRGGGQKKREEDLAREIVRVLSGMANADGGTLLVGVEPDKSVTGIPYDHDELQTLIQAPQNLLTPAAQPVLRKSPTRQFAAAQIRSRRPAWRSIASPAAGRFIASPPRRRRCPRIKSTRSKKPRKMSFTNASKRSMRLGSISMPTWSRRSSTKLTTARSTERFSATPITCSITRAALPSPNMAALLLFAKDPTRWHPRGGIDFVKYEGTERQHGSSLNVVKRIRFEAPLVRLIDEAVGRIKEHIRERTILHDLFFRERLEYPTFAWQEALVNAVAHRDYALTGASIEVWMFDDHINVRSPGLPPAPVTLEQLRQQKSIHFSRNPLIVRALADLGYLREMGEGVPRMFQEMESYGLHPPELSLDGFIFTVTLRNAPVYDEATLRWLNQFDAAQINLRQRRLLAYAYCHGKTFSTAEYERIAEVDRDTAYREIRLW